MDGEKKYDELISGAAAEYQEAKGTAQDASTKRLAAGEELAKLTAEAADLKSRLADFEAGIGDPLSAEEFMDASYRVQWLTGAIRVQQKLVQDAQEAERAANFVLQSIHTKARNELDRMLREDYEERRAARRAELELALKGQLAEILWPSPSSQQRKPIKANVV